MKTTASIITVFTALAVPAASALRSDASRDPVPSSHDVQWASIPLDWAQPMDVARRSFIARGSNPECFEMVAIEAGYQPKELNFHEPVMQVHFSHRREYFSINGAPSLKSRVGCGKARSYYMSASSKIVFEHIQR